MNKLMIMVLSMGSGRYLDLMNASLKTWDTIEVDNVKTVFYCGNEGKPSTDKVIYTSVSESLNNMGRKNVEAFRWALNCGFDFDYMMRVNSTCYVNKRTAFDFVQQFHARKSFLGAISPVDIDGKYAFYLWGPTLYLSRDVVEMYVSNSDKLRYSVSEDVDISLLLSQLGVTLDSRGNFASINQKPDGWLVITYGNPFYGGGHISRLDELKGKNIASIRVKQFQHVSVEVDLMRRLFEEQV